MSLRIIGSCKLQVEESTTKHKAAIAPSSNHVDLTVRKAELIYGCLISRAVLRHPATALLMPISIWPHTDIEY